MDCGSQNQSSVHPSGTPAVTCLFCCKLVFLTVNAPGGNSSLKLPRDIIVNICVQMKLDYKEIPEQCLSSRFPFCNECYLRIGFLEMCAKAAHNGVLQIPTDEMASMVKRIRNTVLDSEFLLNPEKQTPDAGLEAQKFYKLREMIIEAFREQWIQEQKAEGNDLSNLQLAVVEQDLCPLKLECSADASNSTLEDSMDPSPIAVKTSATAPECGEQLDCICRQILPSLQNRPRRRLTPQLRFKRHYMQFVHKKFCLMEEDTL